jgi:hypothetical protein
MPGGGKRAAADLLPLAPLLYGAGSAKAKALWRMSVERMKHDTARSMEQDRKK